MEKAEKIKLFNKEINYIHDDILREDAKFLVGSLPDYFLKLMHHLLENIIQNMQQEIKGLQDM